MLRSSSLTSITQGSSWSVIASESSLSLVYLKARPISFLLSSEANGGRPRSKQYPSRWWEGAERMNGRSRDLLLSRLQECLMNRASLRRVRGVERRRTPGVDSSKHAYMNLPRHITSLRSMQLCTWKYTAQIIAQCVTVYSV